MNPVMNWQKVLASLFSFFFCTLCLSLSSSLVTRKQSLLLLNSSLVKQSIYISRLRVPSLRSPSQEETSGVSTALVRSGDSMARVGTRQLPLHNLRFFISFFTSILHRFVDLSPIDSRSPLLVLPPLPFLAARTEHAGTPPLVVSSSPSMVWAGTRCLAPLSASLLETLLTCGPSTPARRSGGGMACPGLSLMEPLSTYDAFLCCFFFFDVIRSLLVLMEPSSSATLLRKSTSNPTPMLPGRSSLVHAPQSLATMHRPSLFATLLLRSTTGLAVNGRSPLAVV